MKSNTYDILMTFYVLSKLYSCTAMQICVNMEITIMRLSIFAPETWEQHIGLGF